MTAISFILFVILISAQFTPCTTPAFLNIKSCQVFFQLSKMSFLLFITAIEAQFKFAALPSGQTDTAAINVSSRRKNKLTFSLHFYPPSSTMGSFSWNDVPVYWCWCELSVNYQRDREVTVGMMRKSSCIYITTDKWAVTTGLRLSLPPSLSTLLMPSPWNSPSLFTWKAFMFLVFHAPATPTSLPLLQLFGSELSLSFTLPLFSSGGEGRFEADIPAYSSAGWPRSSSAGAVEELIALCIGIYISCLPRKFWSCNTLYTFKLYKFFVQPDYILYLFFIMLKHLL